MGVSGAGKDYLAGYLIEHYNYTRFSFSDQLKRIGTLVYPWLDFDYPPIVKEEPLQKRLSTGESITMSPRQIWLHLNSLREVEDRIFIRMLEEEIEDFESRYSDNNILISDVRSTDELEWCKQNDFTVIYIESIKNVYRSYDIDALISHNKDKADFKFINNHDGHSDFKKFYKSIFGIK